MTTKKLLIAATLGASSLLVTHLAAPELARAQSNTTGALTGTVKDSKTGESLPGVTVIATSASLQSAQTAITDEKGQYRITNLPPGEYLVTFYYADITVERGGITVGINKTTPVFQTLNQDAAGGEVVKITDSAPTIDPTSTAQGITIDKNYINNIPVPGRDFESTLGAAAGSQGDGLGISFSGSSSLENQYYVDGVNTTGLTFGTVGSPVINNFIEEIEVITGGYNAEFGRATGAVVNVVTKSGSNEFKGSVFGTYQPGFLTREANVAARNATSLDFAGNVAYNADFGVELGGPIIKDKLWFYVGFAPQFAKVDVTRIPKRQTDCRMVSDEGELSICNPALSTAPNPGFANGEPDVDPATGFLITDPLCGPGSNPFVECEVRSDSARSYNILGKLNYALNPENQGQLTIQALPGHAERPGDSGLVSTGSLTDSLVTDVSFKWTSKFNDNKTELEAVVGWHREAVERGSIDPSLNNVPAQTLVNGQLATWARGFGGETPETIAGCTDGIPGSADPYPNIDNCPMRTRAYQVGGPGNIINDSTERRAAKIGLIQRVKAAGTHEIKAGFDVENNLSNTTRLLSGGALLTNFVGQQIRVNRFVQLADDMNTDPRFNRMCNTPDPNGNGPNAGSATFKCDYLEGTYGSPGTDISGNTFNWSAYLRDSWQIQPNLTLNVGLRYEEQRLRYAEFLQNTTDALTGAELGKNAMTLTGMFAPRVGILYDWTKEGRSKIYAHWGRFYESIPMQINDRSFGGEAFYQQDFVPGGMMPPCGAVDPRIGGPNGEGCLADNPDGSMKVAASEQIIGASGVLIAPGIKSQYMDEIIGGFEYEILDDLKIGLSYQNRRMGRVIEDVSTDGAQTYIIANPGEWSQEEQDKLQARIDRTDDLQEKNRLNRQLELYKGIRIFDKPRRDYNALQFTLTRRFSKKLYVQGSYTYSRTTGNYPGLISYDNGQVDPNISSQYDLIELLANRIGPLTQDRPHYIKVDGYYTFDLQKAGELTTGIRLRALSGIPQQALAGHYLYGPDESFLLPRGQIGRTDFEHGLDIHLAYARKLNKNMRLEIYADVFNVYNRQGSATTDDTYAPQFPQGGDEQNANPIAGGTYEDLMWLKQYNATGVETGTPIHRNPNYRNTIGRYGPSNVRLGMRLTF